MWLSVHLEVGGYVHGYEAFCRHDGGFQKLSSVHGGSLAIFIPPLYQQLFLQAEQLDGVDLNVHVLTTGFWPTQSAAKCNLPPEIIKCCEVFKKYYLSNHNGRRLTWQTNMVCLMHCFSQLDRPYPFLLREQATLGLCSKENVTNCLYQHIKW